MSGVPFLWLKADVLDEKVPENSIWTEIFLVGEIIVRYSNSLGKSVYFVLVEVQTVKIIFLTYVGRVFENLQKKMQKFAKI